MSRFGLFMLERVGLWLLTVGCGDRSACAAGIPSGHSPSKIERSPTAVAGLSRLGVLMCGRVLMCGVALSLAACSSAIPTGPALGQRADIDGNARVADTMLILDTTAVDTITIIKGRAAAALYNHGCTMVITVNVKHR